MSTPTVSQKNETSIPQAMATSAPTKPGTAYTTGKNTVPKKSKRSHKTAKESSKLSPQHVYSVYISPSTVELYEIGTEVSADMRLVCSQLNYLRAFEFAVDLAKNKRLIFQNFVPHGSRY